MKTNINPQCKLYENKITKKNYTFCVLNYANVFNILSGNHSDTIYLYFMLLFVILFDFLGHT